jgi:hypothetical protein
MYMAVLHFTLPAASLGQRRRSGLRIIQDFLEMFCVFPGNLNFVRVTPLTCSLSKAAANIWPVRDLADKKPITKPAVVPDRFSETHPASFTYAYYPQWSGIPNIMIALPNLYELGVSLHKGPVILLVPYPTISRSPPFAWGNRLHGARRSCKVNASIYTSRDTPWGARQTYPRCEDAFRAN